MPTAVETIIWTALPYARSGNTLKLSAMVTFQLTGDGTVLNSSLFPTASNWDASKLKFEVHFKGVASPVIPTTTSQPSIDTTLWKMLIPSEKPLPLISWDKAVAAATGKSLVTFDATSIGAMLTQLHSDHVISSFGATSSASEHFANPLIKAASLPSIHTPVVPNAPIHARAAGATAQVRQTKIKVAASALRAKRAQGIKPDNLESKLIEAHDFFAPQTTAIPKPVFPDLDFHKCMAMVAQHPKLLRVLGIVVDLEIPATGIPASGEVFLKVSGFTGDAAWHFPHTVYDLGADFFRPTPRPIAGSNGQPASYTEVVDGFMNMSPSLVSVGGVDVTGGLIKVTNYATNLANKVARQNFHLLTASPVKPSKLESFKSTVATENPVLLAIDPAAKQPDNPPYNRSSGLTVYKIDRAANYTLARTLVMKNVTTMMSLAASKNSDTSTLAPFYADDLIKGWRPDVLYLGKPNAKWASLNRRTNFYKIGTKVIGPFDDEGQISTALGSNATDPSAQYLHEALFTWNGWSLATPKAGQPIADSGARVNTAPPLNASQAQAFLQSYTFTHAHYPFANSSFNPPGALPPLRYGASYQVRARYVDLAGNSLGWDAPLSSNPNVAQSTSYLRHEPIGPPTLFPVDRKPSHGASAFTLVVRKYMDGHMDSTDTRLIAPSLGDVSHAELHGKLDLPSGAPDPAAYATIKEFDAVGPLPSVISTSGGTPHLPYLPDPAAQGACLVPISDVKVPVQLANFYGGATWPHANWGKITLTAATAAASSVSGGNAFAVALAPGQKVFFNISSTTTEPFLADFSQTWALEQALQPLGFSIVNHVNSKFPKVAEKLQLFNKHTPFHVAAATLKTSPVLLTPVGQIRHVDTGPTPQEIYIQSFLNGRNGAFTPPTQVTTVFATEVPEPGLDSVRIGVNRELNSTKAFFPVVPRVHGWSTEEVEYFLNYTDEVDDLYEPVRTTLDKKLTNRAFSLAVPYQDSQAVYDLVDLPQQEYEFHDTKAHTLNFTLVGKSRYTSCFPAAWLKDPKHPFSVSVPAKAPVIVPSTRRPDAVGVEAVLPLFQWSKTTDGQTTYSGRKGNMLRVFLRRPWFSSGNGEQLAVILAKDLATEDELTHIATMIGADPAFKNPAVTKFLTTEDFHQKAGTADASPPAIKESNQPVTAALYNPVFDAYHQMWVADIEIDLPIRNVYTPFLRLALARYQLHSVANCNVSSITVTDITQLHGDRTAVLQVLTAKKTISVSLTASAVAESMIGKSVVVGLLEQKVGSDPDSGWTPAKDASGNEIENTVPLNEAVAFIAHPRPVSTVPANVAITEPLVTTSTGHQSSIGKATLAEKKFPELIFDKNALNAVKLLTPTGPGIFQLPDPSQTYRIVLREYEVHVGGSAEPAIPTDIKPPSAEHHVVGRLVYVDAIAVP